MRAEKSNCIELTPAQNSATMVENEPDRRVPVLAEPVHLDVDVVTEVGQHPRAKRADPQDRRRTEPLVCDEQWSSLLEECLRILALRGLTPRIGSSIRL